MCIFCVIERFKTIAQQLDSIQREEMLSVTDWSVTVMLCGTGKCSLCILALVCPASVVISCACHSQVLTLFTLKLHLVSMLARQAMFCLRKFFLI